MAIIKVAHVLLLLLLSVSVAGKYRSHAPWLSNVLLYHAPFVTDIRNLVVIIYA